MRVTVRVDHTDANRTRHADLTFVTDFTGVVIDATDELDATLAAHDFVNAVLPGDAMILATTITDIDCV